MAKIDRRCSLALKFEIPAQTDFFDTSFVFFLYPETGTVTDEAGTTLCSIKDFLSTDPKVDYSLIGNILVVLPEKMREEIRSELANKLSDFAPGLFKIEIPVKVERLGANQWRFSTANGTIVGEGRSRGHAARNFEKTFYKAALGERYVLKFSDTEDAN